MKTDRSLSKVKAPAGPAHWQTLRQAGQRAGDSERSGPRPVGSSKRLQGSRCPAELVSSLSVCDSPAGRGSPACPPTPQPQGVSWHNLGNYDRDPEGKTNPSAETGTFLIRFARQEPGSLERITEQSSKDVACCALFRASASDLRAGPVGLALHQPPHRAGPRPPVY